MNSDIISVFVLNTGDSIMAKDKRKDQMAAGELAFIDVNNGLSFDATTADKVQQYKIVQKTSTGYIESAAFRTQTRNTLSLNFYCYTPFQAEIWKVSDIKVDCESSYAMGFLIDNSEINSVFGGSEFRAPVIINTGCCGDAEGCCPEGNCQNGVKLFGEAITNQYGDYVTVIFYDDQDQVIADIDTWIANSANADKCPYFTLTTKEQALELACGLADIPFNDAKIKGYTIRPYFVDTDSYSNCGGTISRTQESIEASVTPYDVRCQEWKARRYLSNDYLYAQSEITGVISRGASLTVDTGKYAAFSLTARQVEDTAEFTRRGTDHTTYIYGECGKSFLEDIDAILNALYSTEGFAAIDASNCSDCVTANVTKETGANLSR